MEALTRLVSESLARHGFDRPLDYRRLRWSRWFRCESHHSLLFVPSKPGVFAVAEEIMDMGTMPQGSYQGTASAERADQDSYQSTASTRRACQGSDHRNASAERVYQGSYQGTASAVPLEAHGRSSALAAGGRRMLAVTQFFEAEDMAFVLDRMLSRPNPMRDRLASGRYFVRFVVIEDQSQRRTICSALNQWMVSAAEKATGIGPHFASSLELTPEATETGVPQVSPPLRDLGVSASRSEIRRSHRPVVDASSEGSTAAPCGAGTLVRDSGAAANIHCPAPFPSGF